MDAEVLNQLITIAAMSGAALVTIGLSCVVIAALSFFSFRSDVDKEKDNGKVEK